MTTSTLHRLIPRLAGRRVIVTGDLILDEYVTGNAARLSREAPIPVLEFESRRFVAGGAANPAANITALGSHALAAGVIGADTAGESLRAVLREAGIDAAGLVIDPSRPTTVKTRILAHMGLRFPQQVARVDTLSRQPIDSAIEAAVHSRVEGQLPHADALLLSDYHTGLLTPSLVDALRRAAIAAGALLTADAQGSLDKYAGFGLVKCNADEARFYLRRRLDGDDDFAAAAVDLRRALQLTRAMIITRGADGMTLADQTRAHHLRAPAVSDVYDTVGAGDTAIAVLTLAAAAGADAVDAAALANYASGVVVRRVGNYAPTPAELIEALDAWGSDRA
jgi:rfaE bifunctional protein kinase chain/domain